MKHKRNLVSNGRYIVGMILWTVILIVVSSCGVKKHLKGKDPIYGGATVELLTPEKFVHPVKIKTDLIAASRPKPVPQTKLWYYYNFGNPEKEKGISNWIQKSFGAPPIFYDERDIDRSSLFLEKHLNDKGYFNSSIYYDTSSTQYKVFVNYKAATTGRYRLRNIAWPKDSTGVTGLLLRNRKNSFLKSNKYYNVDDLIGERLRLNNVARNNGYYLFDESDIFYFVDTALSEVDFRSDVWLQIKPPEDSLRHKKFYIGETHVYPNYNLSLAENLLLGDTVSYKGLSIYQNAVTLKPKILRRAISLRQGAMYQVDKEDQTLNHLLELGVYKFVNQDYKIQQQGDSAILNRYIYLTPSLLQEVSGELELSSRAGNVGLFLKGNYSHKNFLYGAERLDASIGTGFQLGGNVELGQDTVVANTLYEIQGSAEMYLPKFLVPWGDIKNISTKYTPKTKIGLFATYQRRPKLFTLFNTKLSLGYDWRETKEKRHELGVINMNVIRVTNRSPEFDNYLSSRSALAQSFENQLIFGPTYQYTYTNQDLNRVRNYWFFRGKAEFAFELWDESFSEFYSLETDLRYNIQKLNKQLVFRLAPSIVVPYGQSNVVPYSRQYFVGGPSSVRAFPNRSLQGSYIALDKDLPGEIPSQATTSFDQVGDIRLEMNAEYRFDLYKPIYLKGALFLDAGNVWLLDRDDIPAAEKSRVFKANEVLSEMAVGTGMGFRFDVQFIVLRLDFALPLRKPYLDKGERWTWREENSWTTRWMWENLSFNLGVGYPF